MEQLQTIRYWLAVLFVCSMPRAIGYCFVGHPLVNRLRALGTRVALTLVMAGFTATVPLLFLIREPLMGRDLGFDPRLFAIGLVFCVGAFVGEIKTSRQLTRRILVGVPELSTEIQASC